jgi:hypothetical protein
MTPIDIHIIRTYVGPRNMRQERIWDQLVASHPQIRRLVVHDNLATEFPAKRKHAEMLTERVWPAIAAGDAEVALITEFDFLPEKGWLDVADINAKRPVILTEYCTRNSYTRKLIPYGCAGPWFMLFHVGHLKAAGIVPNLGDGGTCKDPAGDLLSQLRGAGLDPVFLPPIDCLPAHYGIRYEGRGTHLFWSRHYHDDPGACVAGFMLGDIQQRVDRAMDEYECPKSA